MIDQEQPIPSSARPKSRSRLGLLLLIPYVILLCPPLYARWTPALFGFPFFYWSQFALVMITAALTAIVSISRDRSKARKAAQ